MSSRVWTLVAGFILLSTIGLSGADAQTKAKASRKLEGTWLVTVTIKNCDTGASLRSFPALLTFAQGGTLTGTTTGFPPAAGTPAYGIWRFEGSAGYTATSAAFLFGPDGVSTGQQTIVQAIVFGDDPDTFTSTASITVRNTNGDTIMTGCATAEAHRMK